MTLNSHRRVGRCGVAAKRARGFTLVEVLVALVIIAIGMLGIAKMQAIALSSTGASRSRALAAIEASSLAAAMHANRNYWAAAGSLPGNIGVTTSGGTNPITSDQAAMQTALTSAGASTALCPQTTTMKATLSCYCIVGASCTSPINMAANDLNDWASGLGSLLPSATATVTCNNANVPVDCSIAITYTENVVGLNRQEAATATSNANTSATTTAGFQYVTYNLYVIP